MRMLSRGRALLASFSILFAAVAPAGVQAAPQDDVKGTLQRFIDAMNTGDFPSAMSICGSATVVDQLAPYVFIAPDGCTRWIGAIRAMVVDAGVTSVNAVTDPATAIDVRDASAYVVLPIKFTVTVKGDRIVKNGFGTFVMTRAADGWKFTHVTFSHPSLTTP